MENGSESSQSRIRIKIPENSKCHHKGDRGSAGIAERSDRAVLLRAPLR